MGLDGIYPHMLRELTELIVKPLSNIFEMSWRRGQIPEDWRIASVTPGRKKGRSGKT